MTFAEIRTRYPRLLRAMRWVACLSDSEAVNCIATYTAGHDYAGEAVHHYGGPRAVLERAASAHIRQTVARLAARP